MKLNQQGAIRMTVSSVSPRLATAQHGDVSHLTWLPARRIHKPICRREVSTVVVTELVLNRIAALAPPKRSVMTER